MFENGKKIKLTDLIDIEFLQEFQDFFAKTMGVASIAVDDNGPITKPSNFTPFCGKYIRGTQEGYKRCRECDVKWGKIVAESGKPVIYKCHSGLTNFAVPITVDDTPVASIIGGQVFTEPPNEEYFRNLAKELGINEEEYIEALKQIKIVPVTTVDAAANFLHLIANAISKIAHKNFELVKNNERESIYRNIIDTIRSSLNIDETKQIIVDIVGKTLGADRCFITEYDKATDKFLVVEDEYLASSDILGYKGSDSNKIVPVFANAFKKGKPLLIKNKEIFLETENQNFDIEREAIEKYDVNSAFSFPLFYHDEFLGVLSIHYVNNEHEISEDEINLITMIGNQIAIALHQAKLYKLTQVDAKRESLLRNIIETIRSSLDIDKTLDVIAFETAKLFNVDRVAVVEFSDKKNFREHIIRKEYKTFENIKSPMIIENYQEKGAFIANYVINSGEPLIINNIEESDINESVINFYKSLDVKSLVWIPIMSKEQELWGFITLSTINNYKNWTDEEKTLLKTISDQVYIAINQAELYEQEQKQSKREQFGRSIIEILRNTIDKNIVKHLFVRSIAKNFNADRVFFSDFDSKNNIYLPTDENSEFLSGPEEKSFVNQDWSADSMIEYIQPLLEKRELKIQCWDEYVKKNVINEDFKSRFEDANVKSSYNFPVLYEGTIMGFFCIEFTHEGCRKLSDEDISNIRNICTQAGIALYHAELYRKEKEAAERERILRGVINKIRSSLDIEDIKYEIVNQIGILFRADRVIIGYYNQILQIPTISQRAEYRASDYVKSFVEVRLDTIPGFIEYIRDAHLRGEDIIFNDLEKHLANNNLRGTGIEKFYRDFGFTSSVALNIDYGGTFLGNLVLTFEQQRNFSEDEINFLRTVADQAGTAFYQAELLDKEKKTAEREVLLRKITETIRSTLDIQEIKNYLVNSIVSYFKADRCFIFEYDLEKDVFPPITTEALSSADIKSILYKDIYEEAKEFVELVKSGKNNIIRDNEKFIEENKELFPVALGFLKKYSIKSDYGFGIFYKNIYFGALVVHFVKNKRYLTDEDIDFLKLFVNQAGVALYQAQLYQKQKETAEKETILREIISDIKLTQNIDKVYNHLITSLVEIFDVSGVIFIAIPDFKYEKLSVKYEYIRNNELLTFQNSEFPDACSAMFLELVKNLNPLIIDDIKNLHADSEGTQKFCSNHSIKSFMAIPLVNPTRDVKIPGIIVICSSNSRTWKQKEIDLLSAIVNAFTSVIWEIKKLSEIDELINTFILTLSKGVQIPLGAQEKTLEFLASQKENKPIGNFKKVINETLVNNKNLFELLTKLLDSYYYESGEKQLNLGHYNIAEIIKNIKNELLESANSKSITINVNIDKNIPEIDIDKDEIGKVIYSLLENAINYTQNNGIIEIKSYKIGQDIVTCVSDNGPGISSEIKEKIFQRYVAVQIIEKKSGSGLGLYLSKLVTEAHGGKIWCESEIGVGTIVCFLLPAHKE